MPTLQALTCFEGSDDRNGGTIWSRATSPRYLKRARPKSKPDRVIQLKCGEWAPMEAANSNIGELRPVRNIKMLFLSDDLWLIISLAFDRFCYSLYYFNDANRFFDG